VKGRVHLGNE
jgi:hypothetical protein